MFPVPDADMMQAGEDEAMTEEAAHSDGEGEASGSV